VTKESTAGKVLIVDDDPAVVRFMGTVVEKAGLLFSGAGSAGEALQLLNESRFALAIVDIRLPDGSGLDLPPKFKEIDPDLPIVIVTGHPGGENVRKSLGAEVDAYLVKPVNPTILLTLLNQLVERGGGTDDSPGSFDRTE
jgi:DNA-binding NtrC family response regulator